MKILLPIDGDNDAELVLDFVFKYQWPSEVEFKVLHVVGSNEAESQAIEAEQDSHSLVNRIAQKLKAKFPKAKVLVEVRFGSAVYEIVESALELHSHMIVMGYRTRQNIKPFFTGSVANGVATVAPCSVAIIRPEKTPAEVGLTAEEYGLELNNSGVKA
jgi:nucleotide-binding universal stress UspA family protein